MADRRATALDAHGAAMDAVSGDGLRLAALPRLGQVTLRAAGDAVAVVGAVVGIDLPTRPSHWNGSDGRVAIWLGPDEWLLLLPDGEAGPMAARIGLALAGRHHAVVDTSAARVGFSLSGATAATLLAGDCPIDLHDRAFPTGSAASTLVARVPAILLRRDDGPTFWVLARPSYAPHLARWLIDAVGAARLPAIPGVSP